MFCCACHEDEDKLAEYNEEGLVTTSKAQSPAPVVVEEAASDIKKPSEPTLPIQARTSCDDTVKEAKTESTPIFQAGTRSDSSIDSNECAEAEEEDLAMRDTTWTITLQRTAPAEMVGLVLEQAFDGMSVRQYPTKGLAKEWNEKNPTLAIRPGDILQEVNGVVYDPSVVGGKDHDVLKELKESQELSIKIKRLTMFQVKIPVQGHGLDLKFQLTCTGQLEVTEVNDGPVKRYNTICGAGKEIVPGDIIVACGGFRSSSSEALSAYLATVAGEPELWVKRSGSYVPAP